ncbi:MAG: glycosyltransferase family 39 protein [Candidatus Aenigmarchaeota archaeon]|nr:glycosyltransferase family 39 protein [Candidatus Aenigmarchaeota archaeon]
MPSFEYFINYDGGALVAHSSNPFCTFFPTVGHFLLGKISMKPYLFADFLIFLLTTLLLLFFLRDLKENYFLGIILFFSVPQVVFNSFWSSCDSSVMLFALASFYSFFLYSKIKNKKLLIITSLFLTFTAMSRYWGIILLLPFFIYFLFNKKWRQMITILMMPIIITSLWLLRNYLEYKNPIYPLFPKIFDGKMVEGMKEYLEPRTPTLELYKIWTIGSFKRFWLTFPLLFFFSTFAWDLKDPIKFIASTFVVLYIFAWLVQGLPSILGTIFPLLNVGLMYTGLGSKYFVVIIPFLIILSIKKFAKFYTKLNKYTKTLFLVLIFSISFIFLIRGKGNSIDSSIYLYQNFSKPYKELWEALLKVDIEQLKTFEALYSSNCSLILTDETSRARDLSQVINSGKELRYISTWSEDVKTKEKADCLLINHSFTKIK